jgi:Carboxypeptidase regulatory-like domain
MRFAVSLIGVMCLLGGAAQGSTLKSGLYGKLTRGPITPVCIAEQPCSAPVPGAMIVFSRAGRAVAHTRTAANGTYRVTLPPGLYNVRVLQTRPVDPGSARVQQGHYRQVDFSIDTGIR